MAYGDPEAPDDGSNDGSSGGDPVGSQGGGSPSVGPGTGRNESNPARGVNVGGVLGGTTGSSSVDSAIEGLLGMLGFDPSAPVTGVNVETETDAVPLGHPDFGLSGTAMDPEAPSPGYASTDPGHTKSVDNQGRALSYNAVVKDNYSKAFLDATINKKTELDALRAVKNRTKKQNLELNNLQRQYTNLIDSDQYSKAMAKNNPALSLGAKALSTALGLGVLGFGPTLEGFATEAGFGVGTLDSPQDVMDRDPLDDAPDGPDGEQSSASFWSLMNVVKNNSSVFKNLSKQELVKLIGNPTKFWKFFQDAVQS
tara:strand:+ start:144 stop:1076 length:933 start_codon:yes stop_codon:yes gene_type:complete